MRVTVKSIGGKELQQAIKKLCAEKIRKIKGETYASGLDIQRKAKQNLKEKKNWDTGNLANSILVDRTNGGFVSEIGPTAPYGPYVEFGAGPHFPPPDALEGWAKRHGFDSAWPICIAISKHGIPARPFLHPAYLDYSDKYFKKIAEIMK